MSLEFNKSLILAVCDDDIVHIMGKRVLDIDRLERCIIMYLEDNILVIESSIITISARDVSIGFQKSDIVGRCIANIYCIIYEYSTYSTIFIDMNDTQPWTLSFRTESVGDLKYILNGRTLDPVNYYTIGGITRRRMSSILGEKVLLDFGKVGAKYVLYFDDGTNLDILYTDGSNICNIIILNRGIIGKCVSINVDIEERCIEKHSSIYTENMFIEASSTVSVSPMRTAILWFYIRYSDRIEVKAEHILGG